MIPRISFSNWEIVVILFLSNALAKSVARTFFASKNMEKLAEIMIYPISVASVSPW
jgi:hypothetical protein